MNSNVLWITKHWGRYIRTHIYAYISYLARRRTNWEEKNSRIYECIILLYSSRTLYTNFSQWKVKFVFQRFRERRNRFENLEQLLTAKCVPRLQKCTQVYRFWSDGIRKHWKCHVLMRFSECIYNIVWELNDYHEWHVRLSCKRALHNDRYDFFGYRYVSLVAARYLLNVNTGFLGAGEMVETSILTTHRFIVYQVCTLSLVRG